MDDIKINGLEIKDFCEETWKEFDNKVDIKNRKVFLGEIGEGMAEQLYFKFNLIRKRTPDSNEPITLIINSPGGSAYEMLSIIDLIKTFDVKINTLAAGKAFSAAAVILLSGTGSRKITEHSYVMLHEVKTGEFDSYSNLKENLSHIEEMQGKILQIITDHTKILKKDLTNKMRLDFYLDAKQALKLGIVDEII